MAVCFFSPSWPDWILPVHDMSKGHIVKENISLIGSVFNSPTPREADFSTNDSKKGLLTKGSCLLIPTLIKIFLFNYCTKNEKK
jgi:hypothetical protein